MVTGCYYEHQLIASTSSMLIINNCSLAGDDISASFPFDLEVIKFLDDLDGKDGERVCCY